MKLRLIAITCLSILMSVQTFADAVCPDIQMVLPEVEGISYLRACYEPPAIDDSGVAALRESVAAPLPEYTPSSFNAFRDAASFHWKRPMIVWNKQRISTEDHSGFVVTGGKRLEGELSIKLVQGQVNEITIVESGKKKKEKIKLKKIESFGLNASDDYVATLAPTFDDGQITFSDDVTWQGKVRFITTNRMLFLADNGRIVQLSPVDLSEYRIQREESSDLFISSQGFFAKSLEEGVAFTLAVNPHPQVKEEKSKAKSFFKSAMTQVVAGAVARGVASGVASTGGSLDAVIFSAEVAGGLTGAYMTGPDQLRSEFLLVENDTKTTHLVHADNVYDVFNQRLAACTEYQEMKISEQVELVKLENVEKMTTILNSCAG